MTMSMASSLSNSISRKPSPSLSYYPSRFHPTSLLDHTHTMLHFSTIRPFSRRSFTIKCSVEPLQSSSSNNPPQAGFGSRKTWITGIVIAILLPFLKNKIRPLSLLKNKIDTVVETAEDMAEVVEKVAEDVEKVAHDVEKELPQGKLKVIVTFVENVAKEAAKDAHLVDNVLHEVEEMEDKVETLIDSYESSDEAKKDSTTEIKDKSSNKLFDEARKDSVAEIKDNSSNKL